jgi:cation:H+ antiporter
MIELLLLIVSVLVLIVASEQVVVRALHIARIVGLSELVIGFLLLAVGTSFPELVTNIISALEGAPQFGVGVLAGANAADVGLVFGIVAMYGVVVRKKDVEIVQIVMMSSVIAFFALVLGRLNELFGIFCLALFALFCYAATKRGYVLGGRERPKFVTPALVEHFAVFGLALVAVLISADGLVNSAVQLANLFGVPAIVIGIFLAIGTTVPELAVSITAVKTGNSRLAIGTAVGSLIVNFSFILGLLSLLSPIQVGFDAAVALSWLLIINAAFLVMVARRRFGRVEGAILITLYALFLITMIKVDVLNGLVTGLSTGLLPVV